MKNLITILVFFGLFSFGCKESKPPVKTFSNTISGFPYILHKDAPGEVAKSGDMVYYHLQHRNGDIVTFDSRRMSANPNKMILPDFTNGAVKPTALLDVFRHMSAGDSAVVRMDLSKLPMKPPGYEYANFMDYHVKMVKIEEGRDPLLYRFQQQVKTMDAEINPVRFDTETGVKEENAAITDAQRSEMWDRSVFETVRSMMREVTREYSAGNLDKKNRLIKLASGIKVFHIIKGTGTDVNSNSNVSIKYIGTTIEGKLFGAEFKRDTNFDFAIGDEKVIPGLQEGVKQMSIGGKAVIFMPPNMAFGAKGRKNVKPNSEVAYFVSLHDVK